MLGTHLTDAGRLVWPRAGDPHGPLPPMLLLLTLVTGLVDAFSYLSLGHVLVANMTGNVVFTGFALGGAAGFVWWAALVAVAAFLFGAWCGGHVHARLGAHRGRHLGAAAALELLLVGVAWIASLVLAQPYRQWSLAALVILLGVALGLQNATARALAVPDLTTTVLTLTLTGIAADATRGGSRWGRRVVPVAAMFVGALAGAALVTGGHPAVTLGVAAALLAV
ncbi:YoaK family protein, partial [Tsukamurella soli]|uniref:YoaK family protein n=1 Tax=Tsukamurella soli TaxID=644556 RepID=UPI0031ED23D6